MNNLEYEKELNDKMLEENDELKVRYFLWDWSRGYGWREVGDTEGYETIEILKEHNKWELGKDDEGIDNARNWKILKAEVIESKFKVKPE